MDKRLTQFDENYYQYPTSIGRGYWGSYPIKNDLSEFENERRGKWLENVKRKTNNKFNQFIFNKLEFRPKNP